MAYFLFSGASSCWESNQTERIAQRFSLSPCTFPIFGFKWKYDRQILMEYIFARIPSTNLVFLYQNDPTRRTSMEFARNIIFSPPSTVAANAARRNPKDVHKWVPITRNAWSFPLKPTDRPNPNIKSEKSNARWSAHSPRLYFDTLIVFSCKLIDSTNKGGTVLEGCRVTGGRSKTPCGELRYVCSPSARNSQMICFRSMFPLVKPYYVSIRCAVNG